jgi:HemY protein
MIRLLLFLVLAAALGWGAVWLSDQPGGEVTLEWLGWRVETSGAVLAIVALVLAAVVTVLWRIVRILWTAPGRIGEARRRSRRMKGYKALTHGMVAVAAGDPEEARRQARKAASLLDEPPLTLLLSAQSAQLNGDEQAAKRFFTQMLEREETAFLGLRGLLRQALDSGDKAQALRLAEQAQAKRPGTPWLQPALLELQTATGQWSRAGETLARAAKQKSVPAEAAFRQQAAILVERARAAEAAGDGAAASDFAWKAWKADPGFGPAASLAVARLGKDGRKRKAARTAHSAWAKAPHPDTARAYLMGLDGAGALDRLRAMERLAAENPEHPETRLALAEAALRAELWGEARRHVQPLTQEGQPQSARACRLMAEIEKAEHADAAAAERWRAQADLAPPDPAWTCGKCGAVAEAWSALCPACGAFATLDWRSPRRVTAVAAIAPSSPAAADADLAIPAAIPPTAEAKPDFGKPAAS